MGMNFATFQFSQAKISPPSGSIELCNLRKCVLAGGRLPTANKQTKQGSRKFKPKPRKTKKTVDSMQLWPSALVLYPTSLRSNKAWYQDLDWPIIIDMSESLGRSDTSGHIVGRPNLYMRYLPPETRLIAAWKKFATSKRPERTVFYGTKEARNNRPAYACQCAGDIIMMDCIILRSWNAFGPTNVHS